MKYRTLVLAIALLLVAALACGGSDETVAPTQPPPPPTTAPPTQPTQPPPPPTTAPPTQPTQPSPIGSGGLDFGLEPTFGEVDLEAGFLPDPYVVPLVSGGSVDVDALDLGTGCTGYAASAPDFSVNWSGDVDYLRFFFVSDDGDDTTMIINGPAGNWFCNDDSPINSGWDPLIEFSRAPSGRYDIWIGSYFSDDYISGNLYITELDYNPSDFAGGGGGGGETGELDITLAPTFGEVDLEAGFIPDPYEVLLVSGGSVDVDALDLGTGCTGYAASAPDFSINWSGDVDYLRFFFVSDEGDDTTMIINGPAGNWFCNDDSPLSSGWDPLIEFSRAPSGRYDIWIGSYFSDDYISGTLYVTELDYHPGNLP